MFLRFPKDFFWGTATSAHQVEGNNRNDWTEWEKDNASCLADESHRKWQSWQQKKFPEMFNPDNYISGKACDHYNLFEKDFDIAKKLGHNAHRFSIEWSRIEPEEGRFNEKEIEHYRKVITALKKREMEPLVTLWQFTLPMWIANNGGVSHRKFTSYFARYASKIASAFPEVKLWITLNEPDVFAGRAYLKGFWPPEKHNAFSYLRALNNLVQAHKAAHKEIKKVNLSARVGIAKHNVYFEMAKDTALNRILKFGADLWWNRYFLWRIKNYQDFIGLNYYNRNLINNGYYKNKNIKLTDFGWEYWPSSLYGALMDLKMYNLPVYITENGIADSDDNQRSEFLSITLESAAKAIRDGIDVRGYFYWSLLDNFEWDKGFWPRFGLVEVDYKTQKRTIRKSAAYYRDIILKNGVELG